MKNKINPRALEMARRQGNVNLPEERTQEARAKETNLGITKFPDLPSESFILGYDNSQHGQFFREAIAKSNDLFAGTRAEIPLKKGEVENMYILKRLGLITAIYNNPQLRSAGLLPITPTQSEHLLKAGNLPKPDKYWEDLALILYDASDKGYNSKEAHALKESIAQHRLDLGLIQSDLEQKLIVVNAGLEKDSSMPHGVKPIILPGITQVYSHEVLEKVGEDSRFDGYGLSGGIPLFTQLGKGKRTLYMPSEKQDIGLRVLIRNRYLYLYAGDWNLADSVAGGRVNFAPQGTQKI